MADIFKIVKGLQDNIVVILIILKGYNEDLYNAIIRHLLAYGSTVWSTRTNYPQPYCD